MLCIFISPLQDGNTAEDDGLSSLEVVEAPKQTKSDAKQKGLYEPQNKAQALMKTGETPFHKQLGGDDGEGQGGSQIKQLQVTSENTVDGSITAKGKSEVSVGKTTLGEPNTEPVSPPVNPLPPPIPLPPPSPPDTCGINDTGLSCDDGKYCTDHDACKKGSCAGEEIKDKDRGTVEISVNFGPILNGIEKFGSIMGVIKKIDVSYSGSGHQKDICCEKKHKKDTPVKEIESGFNATLGSEKIFIPTLSFDIRAVQIGVYVGLDVSTDAKLTGENNLCEDKQCWGGSIGANGGAEAGVAAQDSAKIISVSGSMVSSLRVEGNVKCREIGYELSHDGLKGQISAELFDGFFVATYQKELIKPGDITKGSMPLPL